MRHTSWSECVVEENHSPHGWKRNGVGQVFKAPSRTAPPTEAKGPLTKLHLLKALPPHNSVTLRNQALVTRAFEEHLRSERLQEHIGFLQDGVGCKDIKEKKGGGQGGGVVWFTMKILSARIIIGGGQRTKYREQNQPHLCYFTLVWVPRITLWDRISSNRFLS